MSDTRRFENRFLDAPRLECWNKVHRNNGEQSPPRTIISRWFNKGSRQFRTRYVARSKQDAEDRGLKDENLKDVISYRPHFKDITIPFGKEMEFSAYKK